MIFKSYSSMRSHHCMYMNAAPGAKLCFAPGSVFHLHLYARMNVIYLHCMNVIGTTVAY